MIRKMVLIGVLILFSSIAVGGVCSNIENDIERLNCFDEKFPKLISLKEPENNLDGQIKDKYLPFKESGDKLEGSWLIKNYNDQMTKERSWQAINLDNNVGEKNRITLMLGCINNDPNIAIISTEYLGLSGKNSSVQIKLGNNDPYIEFWTILKNNALRRNESVKKNISFLKSLSEQENIMIRIFPYNSSRITGTVNMQGIDQILNKIKADCPGKDRYWQH